MPKKRINIKFISIVFLALAWLNPNFSYAQIEKKDLKNGGLELNGIYYQQFQAGFSLNTNGYSLNARRTWTTSLAYKRGFEMDIAMIRHPKEINDYNYIGGKSFVYGKLNSLYTVRLGFGEKRKIAKKIDIGSIEISYFYYGGLSLGGVKPIYLEINTAPITSDFVHASTERYDPDKHDLYNIIGGVPFTKGFSEIKIYPGIYTKFGIDFDYKDSTKKIGTLETGVVVDYYFRDVPIMAKTKNYSYFFALYLSINFGKKWN